MTMLWMTMNRPHMQSRRWQKEGREICCAAATGREGLDAELLQKLQVIDGELLR